MNTGNIDYASYAVVKSARRNEAVFVNMADDSAIEAPRNRYGNRDLLILTCRYSAPEPTEPRIYPIYFHIATKDLKKARISALEAYYYITENFQIPQDCLETIYTGGAAGESGGNIDDDGDRSGGARKGDTDSQNIIGTGCTAAEICRSAGQTEGGTAVVAMESHKFLRVRSSDPNECDKET